MKIRIKYSNTQKFTIEPKELTFKALKDAIINYISTTYGQDLESLLLSFNGKEQIIGEDSNSLASLGIVNGDLLIVIQPSLVSVEVDCKKPQPATSSSSNFQLGQHKMSLDRDCGGQNVCNALNKVNNLLESRDGTTPQSVVEYFERYSPTSASEVVNLLAHITMLEAGFILGESPASTSVSLPLCWKDLAATIKYYHPGFQNFNISVVLVSMGDVKQILASFTGQENEISVKVRPKEYAQYNQILPHRLTRLSKFARTFRNDLLVPLQISMHHTLGLPAPWHLAGLPQEILLKIVSMLKVNTVLSLSSSCKRLNISLLDNKLWFDLFKRDFAEHFHASETVSGADWRAKYKVAHERKGQERQKKNAPNLEQPWPFPNIGDPPNPYLPNPANPFNPNPINPFMPQPWGPDPIYPHPDPLPHPNPYWDPDSPYFSGEIPPYRGPFPARQPRGPLQPRQPRGPLQPRQPNPLDPFGIRPNNPLQPPGNNGRGGPRFDFI